ncbi:unnamed protein product [Closterium sp. Yama58-4]|nr:unnamed protein product [Closterium sp. Yama58-4]
MRGADRGHECRCLFFTIFPCTLHSPPIPSLFPFLPSPPFPSPPLPSSLRTNPQVQRLESDRALLKKQVDAFASQPHSISPVRRLESDRALLKKQVDAFASQLHLTNSQLSQAQAALQAVQEQNNAHSNKVRGWPFVSIKKHCVAKSAGGLGAFASQLHLTNSQLAQAQAALQAAQEQNSAHSNKSEEQAAVLRKAVEAAGIERDAAVLAKEDLASQVRVLKRRLQEAEEEQCKAEEASAALAAELRALQHSTEATVDRAGAAFSPDPDQLRVAEAARDAAKAELQDLRQELTGMRQQLIAERQRAAAAAGGKEAVEKQLAAVQASLKGALEAEERLKINAKAEVRQEVEGDLRSDIEAEVRQKLEAEVREAAEVEARKKMESEVRQDVEGKVRKELEAEVREKLKAEVREELGRGAGKSAEEDSKASRLGPAAGSVDVGTQVTSVSEEARKEIEAAAVARMRQELKEEVRKELWDEVEKQVREEVSEKVREEMRKEVEMELKKSKEADTDDPELPVSTSPRQHLELPPVNTSPREALELPPSSAAGISASGERNGEVVALQGDGALVVGSGAVEGGGEDGAGKEDGDGVRGGEDGGVGKRRKEGVEVTGGNSMEVLVEENKKLKDELTAAQNRIRQLSVQALRSDASFKVGVEVGRWAHTGAVLPEALTDQAPVSSGSVLSTGGTR